LHLREDGRHIQDRDLRVLRQTVTVKLNLEMACDSGVLAIAREVRPDQVTLVREETRGGHHRGRAGRCRAESPVREVMAALRDAGIALSLFLDPISARSRSPRSCGRRCRVAHRPIRQRPARPQQESELRPFAGPASRSARPECRCTPATF